MFVFLCLFSILHISVVTTCPTRTLIMTDAESKGAGIGVLEEMRSLMDADSRLSNVAVSAVVYSARKATELLIPWSDKLEDVEKFLEDAGQHPRVIGLPKSRHQAKSASSDSLSAEVALGLKFFERSGSGMILLLTSSTQPTNLTGELLEDKKIPVVLGFLNNTFLGARESEPLLKFVDLSVNKSVKEKAIARFLLYSSCGIMDPVSLGLLKATYYTGNGVSDATNGRRRSAVTAGSVAAASAGVAALSVFAGRWIAARDGKERDEAPDDLPSPAMDRGAHSREFSYSTPVPPSTPRMDNGGTASPVQHISFTMF
eukprot:Gregarina_sp_Poly_1__11206@NODE_91_length_14868_cov_482_446186_g78_i0_p8_GENE_NODE_91_length_14868_cov_482_446186_g78_i0NODE_91_length_14868_cov_482_446186_g78_i0_p8_ORF_typecomplete_len315_score43_84CoatB/PF10389_9/0_42_NODE_91_length_14868_cov_482_446186_g78_i084729416